MSWVSIARYKSRFAQNLAEMVASEADGRFDALSRRRKELAFADARYGEFADLVEAAKPQTLGYAWQNLDLDMWASAGHEAENFGSAPLIDGRLCGERVQHKVSRVSTSGRFSFDELPSPRSTAQNVLLFADSADDMEFWPVFVGTTGDLKRSATILRSLNSRRSATVSQDRSGSWVFGASTLELARFASDLPGFMPLVEYVALRNDCDHCFS